MIKKTLLLLIIILIKSSATVVAQSGYVTCAPCFWHQNTEKFNFADKSRLFRAKVRTTSGKFTDGITFGGLFLSDENDTDGSKTYFTLRYFSDKKVNFYHCNNDIFEIWACPDNINNSQYYKFSLIQHKKLPLNMLICHTDMPQANFFYTVLIEPEVANKLSSIFSNQAASGCVNLNELQSNDMDGFIFILGLAGLIPEDK